MKQKIKDEFFQLVQEEFRRYREDKQPLDRRIIDNNRWFKSRYSEELTGEMPTPSTPSTPYLFNAIANKHADAMDNYPTPNVLERRQEDRGLADTLTRILPLQLEYCNFRKTYSRAWWYKLKNGASCYGVFFNPELRGGIGEIDIRKIDLLNLFWEPGVNDIQDSRFLFLTALMDKEELRQRYPSAGNEVLQSGTITVETYEEHREDQSRDKLLVVDCYYKKKQGNKTTVELLKFCGDTILDATENKGDQGLYAHGKYPFVLDVLYPDEDSPVGFGLVDIIKNPQCYIDRLDWIISRNAMVSGKTRYMVKDNGGLNEYELSDCSKDIIHVAGSVGEDTIRELQAKPLHSYIIQHRSNKIEELKEVVGNRDFQQGETSGGVTAYSAIVALQQAGEKLSRDMIAESYAAFQEIIYLCMELMRQFYDRPHAYRVEKEEYLTVSNQIWGEKSQLAYPLELDISVTAEKNNPYNRAAQNQTLLELWKLGVFQPEMAESARILLSHMYLEGKEKLLEQLGTTARPFRE